MSRAGERGKVLNWVMSYVTDRSQRVSLNGATSGKFSLSFCVPQGCCLGPLLFVVYTSKLFDVIESRLPEVQCFADYSQLYLSFKPDAKTQDKAVTATEKCICDLRSCILQDKLKINEDETSVYNHWFQTTTFQAQRVFNTGRQH